MRRFPGAAGYRLLVESATTERAAWRLKVYPLAILLTLAAAMLFAALVYDADDPESRLGGDYPAFYGAGSITNDGDWDELYSPERQQLEQAGLIDDEGAYLYFSYPPFVGGGYGLLAAIPYQWSFLVHTLLMTVALAGAVWMVRPWLQRFGLPVAAIVVAALAFQPVLRSVVGGQNTTLALLLIATAARLDHDDRPFLAGLAAALLLFKPQFGAVVLPLLLVARRWRMLGGWSAGAATLLALSSLLMGGAWLSEWWSQARQFSNINATANGANFISLPGFLENALGAGSGVAAGIGYSLALVVGAIVAYFWWRVPRHEALTRWALLAAAVVVVAPQTLFYDAGLLLLALVAMLPSLGTKAMRVVTVCVAMSWLQTTGSWLGWSPLGPMAVIAVAGFLVWSVRATRSMTPPLGA